MQTALQEIILALMSTLVSVMGGCVLTDWLTTFYIAYRRVAIRLEDESWLRALLDPPNMLGMQFALSSLSLSSPRMFRETVGGQ